MSKAHSPTHRNGRTGDLLNNREQVCPDCFENFATTEAGDLHLIKNFKIDNRCLEPSSIGLIALENRFGTRVWRKPE